MTDSPDFDPLAVPIRPAATVMLVADRPDLQVLMLRRNAATIFAGDMWVYPGGSVDPDDAERSAPWCSGLDDRAASEQLAVGRGGLAYWVAAIRECFEEAGVLFADLPDDADLAVRLARHRDALNNRRASFCDIVEAERLRLRADQLHLVGHWITPLGSPRRFDTRFFLAPFPDGQEPMHDESEAVHHEWVRPADAVAAWRDDRMAMMSPTARMLMNLAAFESAAQAVAAAASRFDPHQVRVRHDEAGRYHILMPGDAGYDEGDGEREFGWVALRPDR